MSWVGVHPAGWWTHDLTYYFDDTDATTFDQRTALQRLVCHALLDRVPDKGLEEVLESLRSVYDFYTLPALPAKRGVATSVSARRGEIRARPGFSIDLDEF